MATDEGSAPGGGPAPVEWRIAPIFVVLNGVGGAALCGLLVGMVVSGWFGDLAGEVAAAVTVVATLALTAVVVRHPPGLTADERCLVVTNGLKERTLRRSEIERFAVDTRWGRNRVLCAHLRSGAVVRLEVTSVLFSYWSTSRGARLERALSAWLRNDRPGAPTP